VSNLHTDRLEKGCQANRGERHIPIMFVFSVKSTTTRANQHSKRTYTKKRQEMVTSLTSYKWGRKMSKDHFLFFRQGTRCSILGVNGHIRMQKRGKRQGGELSDVAGDAISKTPPSIFRPIAAKIE